MHATIFEYLGCRILGVGDLMQDVAELQLGQAVGDCSLVGVAAGAGIRTLIRQGDGSGAVDPAVCGRCGAAGVLMLMMVAVL